MVSKHAIGMKRLVLFVSPIRADWHLFLNQNNVDYIFEITPHFLPSSSQFILFHSCCYYVRVFRKTVVHEFPISYNHTE